MSHYAKTGHTNAKVKNKYRKNANIKMSRGKPKILRCAQNDNML
jgi:hypothetical protein